MRSILLHHFGQMRCSVTMLIGLVMASYAMDHESNVLPLFSPCSALDPASLSWESLGSRGPICESPPKLSLSLLHSRVAYRFLVPVAVPALFLPPLLAHLDAEHKSLVFYFLPHLVADPLPKQVLYGYHRITPRFNVSALHLSLSQLPA